jgi:predicted neuraminidase
LPPLSTTSRILFILATGVTAAVAGFRPFTARSEAPNRIGPSIHEVADRGRGEQTPVFRQAWVSPVGHTPSAHSCATCVLPGGDLLAVWFGGTREGASDVALFTARYDVKNAAWLPPVMAMDRHTAQRELGRRIKTIGNAVVFPDRDGTLWLVYVSVTVGGWSGSALNVRSSTDQGRTWSESRRLTVNPFLNFSSLVRNKPVYASDGRIGLPVYHESAFQYPQMLWLTVGAAGTVDEYRMRNISHGPGLIQPAVVPLGNNRAAMMLRDKGGQGRIHTAYSDDNGWSWSEPEPIVLPNPNAAVDSLRLRDGRLLIAYNDATNGRENLRLAVSADDGQTWVAGPKVEDELLQEYSYPCLVEDERGRIHLTYTWKRQRIKHVEFNLAWLGESLRATPARP